MPPNPRRMYVMMAMPSFVLSASAAACSEPVCTSAVDGTSGVSFSTSSSGVTPSVRRDGDRVEVPLLLEEGLRGRNVEHGERRPAERVERAEPRDARDLVLLHRPERGHSDLVADGVAAVVRGVRVDDDLVGSARPDPLGEASAARTGAHWSPARRRTWARLRRRRSSCRLRPRAGRDSSWTGGRGSRRPQPRPRGAPRCLRGRSRERAHDRSRRTRAAASRSRPRRCRRTTRRRPCRTPSGTCRSGHTCR